VGRVHNGKFFNRVSLEKQVSQKAEETFHITDVPQTVDESPLQEPETDVCSKDTGKPKKPKRDKKNKNTRSK
jgi:hypothetical protein